MRAPLHNSLTRRQLLWGAGSAAALAAAGCGVIDERVPRIPSFPTKRSGPARTFRSRPDLRPPSVTARAAVRDVDNDAPLLFLGPGPLSLELGPRPISQYGPLIVDRSGEPVWFRTPSTGVEVTNFAASLYRGQPVLTWWEGKILPTGYGQGEGVIVDRNYQEVHRVRAANGRSMDLHEFRLTPEGTALLTCYPDTVQADLSSIGGPRNGRVLESILQEVDVASGRLLMEWRSLDHIPVSDSFHPLADPYDYLHANSIAPTPDGDLLVSSRHTWSLYKLDRRSGNLLWRLGGKRSQLQLGVGARFAWQHDARQLSDNVLTLFDNGSDGDTQTEGQSRGLVLNLDEQRRTVQLRSAYTSSRHLVAAGMGSVQMLASGGVVVCWGSAPYTSQFDPHGRLIRDSRLPWGLYSYRGSWSAWNGAPSYPPAIATHRDRGTGAELVYASWNGATELAGWRIDAGLRSSQLRPVGIAKRRGFETVIPIDPRMQYAAVTAIDATGAHLGRSETIRI
jgi:hypothetical protein